MNGILQLGHKWELLSIMSWPVKDVLMSPWPAWLFTGCPLPICQSELASHLTARGNERHLCLQYLKREATETWHAMVHVCKLPVIPYVMLSSIEMKCTQRFLQYSTMLQILQVFNKGLSHSTELATIIFRLMQRYYSHLSLSLRILIHNTHRSCQSPRGCDLAGSLLHYTPA